MICNNLNCLFAEAFLVNVVKFVEQYSGKEKGCQISIAMNEESATGFRIM